MKQQSVPFFSLLEQTQAIKPACLQAFETILDNQQFIGGPSIAALEQEVARYLKVKHVISCNSGTDALWIAVHALEVKPNDIVLTTPFSFIASASELIPHGAHPVFIDVDAATYNIDPQLLRHWLTTNTYRSGNRTIHRETGFPVVGMIPVHLFGQCADMESLLAIAQEFNLWIIEDTAQAIGSKLEISKPLKSVLRDALNIPIIQNIDIAQGCPSRQPYGLPQDERGKDRMSGGIGHDEQEKILGATTTHPEETHKASGVEEHLLSAHPEEHSSECVSKDALERSTRTYYAGTMGNVGTFSFYPTKNLGAFGDAGCMVTNDDALAAQLLRLRNHGRKDHYNYEGYGLNSRLDALQAEVIRIKLKLVDGYNEKRQSIAARYNAALRDIAYIQTPTTVHGEHTYHQYAVVIRQEVCGMSRDMVAKKLETHGIGTRVFYPQSLPMIDYLRTRADLQTATPIADFLTSNILALPIWPEMSDAQVDHVINALKTMPLSVMSHRSSSAQVI